MTRRGCILSFALLAIVVLTAAEGPSISITDPEDRATVSMRPQVSGQVTGEVASVWVVVHPTGTDGYWVQQSVRDIQDGKWSTRIYIGRPGAIDVDKEYEVRAVADPEEQLEEGAELKGWPKARAVSAPLRLKRGS